MMVQTVGSRRFRSTGYRRSTIGRSFSMVNCGCWWAIPASSSDTTRYSREALQANLRWLRDRIATGGSPVDFGFTWLAPRGRGAGLSDLPHKWRVVLDCPAVRLDPLEQVRVAVGDVAETRRGRTRPPSGLAVLGSRELVIANEPAEYRDRERYGVDVLTVPRHLLGSLSWDGQSLMVRLAGDDPGAERASPVISPLDPSLVAAMRQAFGSAIAWV